MDQQNPRTYRSIYLSFIVVLLGLCSSIITAIISALILSEIINALLYKERKDQHHHHRGFSIGLGAALTPIGEPLPQLLSLNSVSNFSTC